MAYFKRRIGRTKKPSQLTPIDRNSITRGLEFYHGFIDGHHDLIAHNVITDATTTSYWSSGVRGKAFFRQASIDGNAAFSIPYAPPVSGGSIFFEYELKSAVDFKRLFATDTSGNLELRRNYSTDTIYIGSTSTNLSAKDLTDIGYHRFILTWDGTTAECHHNVVDTEQITSQTGLSIGATAHNTTFNIGSAASGNNTVHSATGDLLIYQVALWNRHISSAEATDFLQNPYKLFTPVEQSIFIPDAAGAYTLTADAGSYNYTGQNAGLLYNRTLISDAGSYNYIGQNTGLLHNRRTQAANGVYNYTGFDITLTYTPISGATYTLTAAAASYIYTGQNAGLLYNRILTSETGAYSYAGQGVGLYHNRTLTAEDGIYSYNGQNITFLKNYMIPINSGSYDYTGLPVTLTYSAFTPFIPIWRTVSVEAEDRTISVNHEDRTIITEGL